MGRPAQQEHKLKISHENLGYSYFLTLPTLSTAIPDELIQPNSTKV
ncbi:hypothetical protein EZMO1_3730 [Endozoicomonas montiporae CL-33]|uniref:Uncharacterized protein n=1 Tax=Endozoicomonas montiporae CL-33 TaxID=570277 RepID=A0A142BG13_9GAMM|nr:hypothetical protein EZMO1_3730 [Endozoicomonas montiporae CL-33]